ncbi:MAG: ATP-binding protein [Saprospiraceae bacterium]|nr:ATP-binding protein [Saprospiraceae bacterium]
MKSPFQFLDAFDIRDRDSFFGRDKEIEQLYQMVFKTPLALVYGLSGTGKTSLIQCGLASKFDGPEWYPIFIRRNTNINLSIRNALQPALGGARYQSLSDSVSKIIDDYFRPVYLIFDQFEELFIMGTEEEQNEFMYSLRDLLNSNLSCKVILVMREEFIGHLYPFESLIPNLFDFRLRVEQMHAAKVKDVVRSSFHKFNLHFDGDEEDSLQMMIDNISDPKHGIALPYLQVYLDRLYLTDYKRTYGDQPQDEQHPELIIEKHEIESFGTIENVLESFLDEQVINIQKNLKEEIKKLPDNYVKEILDAFVTDSGTKRPINYQRERDEILLSPEAQSLFPEGPEEAFDRCIRALDTSRLLRVKDDSMELAHDSLAAMINERRSDEKRHLNEVRKRIMNAYHEYENSRLFLNAQQIASFQEFIPKLGLDKSIRKFIGASKRELRRVEERRIRISRIIAILGVLSFIGAGVAGWMWLDARGKNQTILDQKLEAEKLRDQAVKEKNTADSLRIEGEKLQQELTSNQDSLIAQRDILDSILNVVDSIFDLSSRGVEKVAIKEASIVGDNNFFTTASMSGLNPGPRQSEFQANRTVYAWARINSPQVEKIDFQWYSSASELINADKATLGINTAGYRVYKQHRFAQAGDYYVKIFNGSGKEIGRIDFTVK